MQNMDKFEHVLSGDPKKRVGEQVGHYRLMSWLGRGAFADVYLGEHIYLKKQSAIKILHVHLSEKAQKDFLNEACTIAQLDHPNIVHVFDYGLENGTPFLVMAYAPNGSLRQRFPEGTCVPLEQVIPLVQQMAAALDYAHQHQVIHRDVKPENMLIGAQNQVLLSDFGLALSALNVHSQTAHGMAGTALYMAPELLRRSKAHFASDQYALGVVTYQWLCGQCPFTGSSFIQIGTQHVLAEPPSLCESVPNLPPAVERVVLKALAKDRAQRYEHVTAFANALQDAYQAATSIPANLSMLTTTQGSSYPSYAFPSGPSYPPPSVPPHKTKIWVILSVILLIFLVGTTTALLVVGPSWLPQMVRGGTVALQITPVPPTSQAPTPASALPTPTAQPSARPEQHAQSIIDHYYTAINSKDYQTAYNLWLTYPDTYQNFANGFANTSYDNYTFGNIAQQSDGTVQVDITIIATSTSSQQTIYQGYYIVAQQSDGTWNIISAKVHQVD